jgi:hypothetical protein
VNEQATFASIRPEAFWTELLFRLAPSSARVSCDNKDCGIVDCAIDRAEKEPVDYSDPSEGFLFSSIRSGAPEAPGGWEQRSTQPSGLSYPSV